jgi:6-phosphogluconate dehydrogenase
MQLGMIGLGRMGGNIVRRLQRDGHRCTVYDRDPAAAAALAPSGAVGAGSVEALVAGLTDSPKAIWVMLPAGRITQGMVEQLAGLLKAGDIIIDGGNSFYKDDIANAAMLKPKGIHFVDVGTSGGVWGLDRGYCMMIGGSKEAVDHLDPIFKTLAPGRGTIERTRGREALSDNRAEEGYIHAGPTGAGHFVKMVHNGVEYGLMQAYAEGFDVLKQKNSTELPEDQRFDLNLTDIAEVWRRGSVVSSWLLDLTALALTASPDLAHFSGHVADSGEGRWTLEAAVEEAVPANVLAAALFARFRSREDHTFGEKLLSAMRFGFGGHVETGTPSSAAASAR